MMIRAMAHAGRLLGRQDFVDSAGRAFEFVRAQLWRDNRLLATTKDGKAHLNGYLDDYVHLMDGGLALLQARFRAADLDFIRDLADTVLARFEDKTRGGFYFTSDDHESLLHRPKPAGDDAILGQRYRGTGAAQARAPAGRNPLSRRRRTHAHGARRRRGAVSLGSLRPVAGARRIPEPAPDHCAARRARCTQVLARTLRDTLCPGRTALAIPSDVTNLTGLLAERRVQGNITAYLCSGHACQAPVSTFEEFEKALHASETTG